MFGERLKTAREKAGLSQDEVAKKIGVSQAAYSYYESGLKTPLLPVATRLASVLHTSLDYLVGNSDN